MKKANKYKFQIPSKSSDPESDTSPFANVTLGSPEEGEKEKVENPWTIKGPDNPGGYPTASIPTMEEDRLSNIYTGMDMDSVQRRSTKKFFNPTGPTMFQHFQRSRFSGEVNPAYQRDDNESVDENSVDNLGGSSSSTVDNDESETDEDEFPSDAKSPPSDHEDEKFVPNGHVLGKDLTVNFEAIAPQSHPPPQPYRRSTKKTKEKPKWDVFTTSAKNNFSNQDVQFWGTVFVVTKVVVCCLLFLFTLATAVVAKMCFVIVIANMYPANGTIIANGTFLEDVNHNSTWNRLKTSNHMLTYDIRNTNPLWIWSMIMMMGAPYLFSFLDSFWRVFFQMSHRHTPSCLTIFLVFLIEFLHSLGVNIMMLVVLPSFDPISALLLMLCIGIMPGCLKVIYPRVKKDDDEYTGSTMDKMRSCGSALLVGTVSMIGAIGQLLSLGLWCYHLYRSFDGHHDVGSYWAYLMCLIIGPLLTSIHWWENFVYQGKKDSYGLPLLARNIRKCRTKLNMMASLWKLVLSVVLPTILMTIFCDDSAQKCVDTLYMTPNSNYSIINTRLLRQSFFKDDYFHKNNCNDYLPLVIGAIGILSSGLLFKLCKVACKILTQIFDMSLPLALSVPTTLGIILAMYSRRQITEQDSSCYPFPVWNGNIKHYFDELTGDPLLWLPWAAGSAAFLSFLIVTNYIWLPGKERLQRTDKLFVRPLYCGIFTDLSIMLNRRRIEHAKHRDTKGKKPNITLPLPDTDEQDLSKKSLYSTDNTPKIYMCATMWHENENEMTQLLKSIFRMDEDQCTRKHAQFLLNRRDPDYYEFEAHIFFDDAFLAHKDDEYEYTVNSYVKELMKTVAFSASAIHGVAFKLKKPVKIATPYGGRLVWSLPGGNQLIAHLKDKQVIRHRKRWSQVMYMYYFLAYELFRSGSKKAKRLQKRADNTFLLALDGDVDFQPGSVLLLVDRMRKNHEVGAACGRIHPIGNGAMVWYQKFEYAVSHWLQKAAEDKLGCVLCSPGCFSMFRGSSLMDDNVMNKYTTPPSDPRHYVQYDQGEDRWLCTLLLQQGHRVEYCAASDALTYAPEGFFEFFNQRRRWTPSTMANILDLLSDWKNVTKKNPDISLIYIFYQGLLMVSSILTPGTIFLMILGAISMAYPTVDLWVSLLINTVPIAVMVLLCFCAKSEMQLNYAAILSTAYSLVMMIVIVGLLQQAVDYAFCSVTTIFLSFVAGVFVIAAFIHPQEFWCLIHGFLYFLAIPSMSMVLMIYSLGNLHVVSWGTRENKTAAEVKEEKLTQGLSGVLNSLTMCCPGNAARADDRRLQKILERLGHIEDNISNFSMTRSDKSSMAQSLMPRSGTPIMVGEDASAQRFSQLAYTLEGGTTSNPAFEEDKQKPRDMMVDPFWMEDEDMDRLSRGKINDDEKMFWEELIEQYLQPIVESPAEKERLTGELIELRNKVCLIFLLINSLFIIIVFSLQQVVAENSNLSISICPSQGDDPAQRIEPISMAFTLVFGVLLLLQFICMLLHRIATLLHICAATDIFKKKTKVNLQGDEEQQQQQQPPTELSYDQAMSFVRDLQKDQDDDTVSVLSESSIGDSEVNSEVDDDEEAANRRTEMKARWKKLAKARQRNKFSRNTLGANFRKNFQTVQSFIARDEEMNDDSDKEDSEEEIQEMKKKKEFRRFTHQSLHTLAAIKRNSELKKTIVKKKITAKANFVGIVNRVQIQNVKDRLGNTASNDKSGGGRKTSSDLLSRIVKAAKDQEDMKKQLAAVEDTEDDDLDAAAVVVDMQDPLYSFVNETNTKQKFDIQAELHINHDDDDKDNESEKDIVAETVFEENKKVDENDDDQNYDDTAVLRLSVPKVDSDKWPEETDYAVGDGEATGQFEDVKL